MPILPENRKRYPVNWNEISLQIRTEAQWCCEFCGAKHGHLHPETGSLVVLTVAHLDHMPEHNERKNLRALCQKCHNGYDAKHRQMTRWKRKHKKQIHFLKALEVVDER